MSTVKQISKKDKKSFFPSRFHVCSPFSFLLYFAHFLSSFSLASFLSSTFIHASSLFFPSLLLSILAFFSFRSSCMRSFLPSFLPTLNPSFLPFLLSTKTIGNDSKVDVSSIHLSLLPFLFRLFTHSILLSFLLSLNPSFFSSLH